MAGNITLDGVDDGFGGDACDRMALIANRSCLMAIDTVLRAVPGDDSDHPHPTGDADAAAQVAAMARRMLQATRDFRAAMQDAPGAQPAPQPAPQPAE